MTDLLSQIRALNRFGDLAIAEPFAGGAGASLSLLYREDAFRILINDADKAMGDFWWLVVNRSKTFIDMLIEKPVSIAEWYRQRDMYHKTRSSRLCRGFSAFYLNRCNRSGIIMNGGPIGGYEQNGKWKIDARYNKPELKRRCEKIAEYRDRISVSSRDGLEFIDSLDLSSTFCFIDPPYFAKGKTLYLNLLDEEYHEGLAAQLKSMRNAAWVLTYDDCPEIRRMYEGWATIRPFSFRYSASVRRQGEEVLIVPKWIQLPNAQKSRAIFW